MNESANLIHPRRPSHNRSIHCLGGSIQRLFQYILKYTWIFIRGFWPIIAGAAVSDNLRAYGEWIGLGVLIIACLSAVVQYWKFTFQVTHDALVIRRGLLERERITIIERIQMVNLEQSLGSECLGSDLSGHGRIERRRS